MPAYQRSDLPKLLAAINQGKPCPVYLLVGDRYLCQQAAEQLAEALIPEARAREQGLKLIDGDQEEPLRTLSWLKTYSLFGGRQVFKVSGTRLFPAQKEAASGIWDKARTAHERGETRKASAGLRQLAALAKCTPQELAGLNDEEWQAAFAFPRPDTGWLQEGAPNDGQSAPGGGDVESQYLAALAEGWPADNILVLLADSADKRKRLYAGLLKAGVVLDLTVAEGSAKAAREQQDSLLAELTRDTLAGFGKTMEPRALPAFLERVGFHPVAVVREAEKLALYAGAAERIGLADVQLMVGRIREDALFELTEAFGDRDLSQTLTLATRLHENGVHPLMVVAGLRNYLRKLMLACSLRQSGPPDYVEGMTFPLFQKGYLPALKESRGEWLKQLPGHPYALHLMFVRAGRYTVRQLWDMLENLLNAELTLKSSPLPPLTVLEDFFWRVMPGTGSQRG